MTLDLPGGGVVPFDSLEGYSELLRRVDVIAADGLRDAEPRS